MKSIITSLTLAVLGLSLFAGSASAQAGAMTQTTDHYKFTLDIGPLATMLMPDQVAGAKQGEAMVQMPGMAMPEMTMTDQGQPVNHHLELHVYDKASGAVIKDMAPTITIANQATGTSRQLSAAAPMYDVAMGESDFHWGNNVYLADGMYTVTAKISGDTATFKDVSISAVPSMAMPAQGVTPTAPATGPMTTTVGMTTTTGAPTTMPMTGGTLSLGLNWAEAIGGLAIIALGLVFARRAYKKN